MTYAALLAEIALYLDRTDLTSRIVLWADLAKRDLERGQFILDGKVTAINWNCMKKRQTTSSDEAYITMPSKIKEVRWMKILFETRYYDLIQKSPENAITLYPFVSGTGIPTARPKVYAFFDEQTEILVRPSPDQSYTYDIGFYAYSALMTDTDTNWWLSNAYELLLYGSLIQSEPYIFNDPRMATWKSMYEEGIMKLAKAEKAAADAGKAMVLQPYLPRQLRSSAEAFDIDVLED
jgi:hypothetical protein